MSRVDVTELRPSEIRKKPVKQEWSDEALAIACGNRDPAAAAELYSRYRLPVTRYLTRLLGRSDVEDLVQTTFLQVARLQGKFEGRSSVKTWLFAIATNITKEHCRKSARHLRLLLTLSTNGETGGGDRLSEEVDARRSLSRVRSAYASLPETVKTAYFLCEWEAMTAKEASVVLRTSESAVWKRVSEARKRLVAAATGADSR